MSEVQLAYGRSMVTYEAEESRFDLLSSTAPKLETLSDVEINQAIDAPIGSPQLDDLISTGDSVLIVVSDATRATASAQIVNLLVRRLIAAGISPIDIGIIFATGIHRPVTAAEKSELLTPFIYQRIKTLDHDASDPSRMADFGTTERGTKIELNRALKEYDRVILTGGLGFHYFAGFTGGRKSVSPGLASKTTITETHMLAMDFETGGRRAGVGTGLLGGNAVSEECELIAEKIAPAFLINTFVNSAGHATRVFAGDWREAHRKACREYYERNTVSIPEKRPVVVASCGGYPFDINLIQAHKTLDMAAHACADGGTIILLAECADGLGRPDFMKWFEEPDSSALADRLRIGYEVNGQTAWTLMAKAERFRVCLISTLPTDQVERMRMVPVRSIEEGVARTGPLEKGYIIGRGASLLPVIN